MKVMEHVFKIPTFIKIGKGNKKYYLNLNNYRNWHYQVSNNLKMEFVKIMKEQMPVSIDIENKVDIEYKLFAKDRRRRDKGNVLCIIQKFLLDALTEFEVWEDDNDEIVGNETFLESEFDEKKEGYIIVKIIPRCKNSQ